MKEIIEHGFKKYKTECFTCNCKFTYEIEDIEDEHNVICPDCGHPVAHFPSDYVFNSRLKDE